MRILGAKDGPSVKLDRLQGYGRTDVVVLSRLVGAHQRSNIAVATATMMSLMRAQVVNANPEQMFAGISSVSLPGRFQVETVRTGAYTPLNGLSASNQTFFGNVDALCVFNTVQIH